MIGRESFLFWETGANADHPAVRGTVFAGITAILAKIGMEHVNSTLATALRTIVVLYSWLMVFVVGSQGEIASPGGAHRANHRHRGAGGCDG